MGVLVIKDNDIVRKKYSKKIPKTFPPYDISVNIIFHCKSVDEIAGLVIADRYEALDTEGKELSQQKLIGDGNEIIELTKLNDDTVFESVKNEQIFRPFAWLDKGTKQWTIANKLYGSLVDAQTDLKVMEVAPLRITNNGNYYIVDDKLVPLAK